MPSLFKNRYWRVRRIYLIVFFTVMLILYQIIFLLPKENNTQSIASNITIEEIQSLLTDHVYYRPNISFIKINESLETTIECIGPLYNQSCLYKNLYYVNSTFMVLIVNGRILPNLTVRSDYHPYWDLTPTTHEFESYETLEKFVLNIVDPVLVPDLTVYFHQLWHFNIGHMLFDGLYPAYLALIRFAPKHLQLFRLLVGLSKYGDKWMLDVCSRFAGLGIMRLDVLNNMSAKKWFVFESLLMGSGNMCQRCIQPDAQLPGGIEMDGSRLFRKRMYEKHGLLPPIARTHRDLLIAYVIDNKRFTPDDRKEIYDAINEINTNTALIERSLINITFLNYSHIIPQVKTSQHYDFQSLGNASIETKFQAHLRIVRSMDIQITGPGTGQMYQTFLSDGTVIINLGGVESYNHSNKRIYYTSFMEQYMTAGTPYIKGLYYPINERTKGLRKIEIVKLIMKAAELVLNRFTIPVDSTDNLAADGRLFKEMCARDKQFCTLVTDRLVERPFPCLDFWFERFVHETAQWSVEGIIHEGKNISCHFNRILLHKLRKKYGIDHYIN